MTAWQTVILAGLLSACGGRVALPVDAGTDARSAELPRDVGMDGTVLDAAIDPDLDAGCDPILGCSCPTDDVVMCRAGGGLQCCGSRWRTFIDGPCWMPPDAGTGGPPDCSGGSSAGGCPCDIEGEMICGYFYEWNRACHGGIWVTLVGHMCC